MSRPRGVEAFLRTFKTCPGLYREFAPAADLRDVVACNWVSVVKRGRFGRLTPIIPDGCSDIMLYDAEAPQVVGPDSRMRWTDLPDGLVIVGLRLRPGAIRAVFGCSAALVLDRQMRLRDLRPVPASFMSDLDRACTLDRRHGLLENWVRESRANGGASDEAIVAACRVMSSDSAPTLDAVSRTLGWNARTIHRQFVAACGYGPKHLQRVMRVQAALRVAGDPAMRPSLSDIASAAGFADQAHMTREFKDLAGFTPAVYLASYSPAVGAWLAGDFHGGGCPNHSRPA